MLHYETTQQINTDHGIITVIILICEKKNQKAVLNGFQKQQVDN